MPAPATRPTWATDATFTSGPDSGEPTKETPAPSSGVRAQGLVPGAEFTGQRFNWILNLVGAWIDFFADFLDQEEFVYPTPKNRTKWLDVHGLAHQTSYVDIAGTAAGIDPTLLEGWYPSKYIIAGAPDTISNDGSYVANIPNLWGLKGFSSDVTKAMTLTAVAFRVIMGTAEATADQRIQVALYKRVISTGVVTTIGTGTCANSTSEQTVTISGLSDAIDTDTYVYYWAVRSSQNCTGVSADRIVGVQLGYTEAALRTD